MTQSIDTILENHAETHGDFADVAHIAQDLKAIMRAYKKGWVRLSDTQTEALEMIVAKIARTLSGNPNEPDHWDDIAGYARLVSQRLVSQRLGRAPEGTPGI